MTPMKEDYLKIIFELGGKSKKISNKQIAMGLNIAAGSVTEMVTKLVEEGLAKHTPYAGISLTDEGIQIAEIMVRKHRIWETFLVDKLDYKLSEVDTDAEVLEHVTSDHLLDSLDKFLDYPTHCPHGGVIPDKEGNYHEDSHTLLADVKEGTTVTVDRFIDNHELLNYLDEIDLDIGDKVHVIHHAPFEGATTVKLIDNDSATDERQISYKAAHYVFVQED
ncbi:metal-dependent transcriptional regulator [Pediococcus inopinatus]|uniref:Manganese transport regulator n=1 Tax=Pediococcus inopinatus TaxID=114090 RepID=A0ABZ0Q6V6_9LACO|nr:metal-dependent transcriptional regulator [Pediococcus inopinatus]AVK99592.1 Cro/Cl family transcriptional regulator [Pediococcus inopinatus]WPC17315.1 metal-dependent transcriptional regulator [Pediococcus inopinatus]WPC18679.1 metal-dependent transcriptional regulator [Pediococcus inopinatus]WPC22293.1 metal-dependent transcriptional regulator [Pediococcus inopinatus]WPP08772.1 metal-dependent transcriptional regulator [Pediococcus inopinatus]